MIYETFMACGLVYCADRLLRNYVQSKTRWYALHFLVNCVIVCLTFSDMVSILTRPFQLTGSDMNWPSAFVMALHVHHGLFYPLVKLDIIHHVVMCGIMLIPMTIQDPIFIQYCNYCLFYVCGLPGGIDYAMMTLVTEGHLSKKTEKKINMFLNMWLRAPGLMYAIFLLYLQYLMDRVSIYCAMPVIIALFWNAQYFSMIVAMSYGAICLCPF